MRRTEIGGRVPLGTPSPYCRIGRGWRSFDRTHKILRKLRNACENCGVQRRCVGVAKAAEAK